MNHKKTTKFRLVQLLLLLAAVLLVASTGCDQVSAQTGLQPPDLSSPENGAVTSNRRPGFDWADVNGATFYKIQVSKTPTFDVLLVNVKVNASNYTPSSDLPLKTLYWRVKARNDNAASSWSKVLKFTVMGSNYYVSPSGNNSNPGTKESPWATIEKATSSVSKGDKIIVMPGTYNEQVNLTANKITLEANGKVNTKAIFVNGDNNTVRGFTISDSKSSAGIEVHGNNNLFERNEIYHTKQDGIWFFGSYNIFRENYIHDILDPSITSNTHVDCYMTWGWDMNTTNVLFEKNVCVNNRTTGLNALVMITRKSTTEVRDLTFRNNVFVINKPVYCSINFWGPTDYPKISNITFINNTVVNLSGKGENAIQFVNITSATAINNLFIGFGNKNEYIPYIIPQGSTQVNIRNNAVYNPNGIAPTGKPYTGDIWMKNPLVESLSGLDFRLKTGSPMIDAGYNLGGLVIDDFEDVLRPSGNGYDIGAYEYPSP